MEMLAALVGAVIGGALTLSGDILLGGYRERRRRDRLLRAVYRDLEHILGSIPPSAKAGQALFEFRPSFPTKSWDLLVASGLLEGVEVTLRARLDEVYHLVEAANYLYTMVPAWLQLSAALGTDPNAEPFRQAAQSAARFPSDVLRPKIDECLAASPRLLAANTLNNTEKG